MRYELRLFGLITLLTLDIEPYELEAEEGDEADIAGGSIHNFERATNDAPSEIEGEPWEDRKAKFGFRGGA